MRTSAETIPNTILYTRRVCGAAHISPGPHACAGRKIRGPAKNRATRAPPIKNGRYGSSNVRFPIHAPLKPIASQPQKRSNLAEFESQALYTANESECLHVALGVLTESPLCSRWSWEQCIAFVESNRVNAETDFFRDDANLHGLAPS